MRHSMKNMTITKHSFLRFVICILAITFVTHTPVQAQKLQGKKQREYLQIKIYHATDSAHVAIIDQYLQASLIPVLEKNGFRKTGVFKAIDNDTARDKRVYVMIPFTALTQLERLNAIAEKTILDSVTARAYTKAVFNKAPFTRIETVLLYSFEGAPQVVPSGLKGDKAARVYELRSYESATEALHLNKVQMFNAGEVELFDRLGFNAVFYGQVIAGNRMPNLMYMTSFDDKASRDAHWKAFGGDPAWKTMSSKPEYQNNVSKIEIVFLRPVAYSRL